MSMTSFERVPRGKCMGKTRCSQTPECSSADSRSLYARSRKKKRTRLVNCERSMVSLISTRASIAQLHEGTK